MVERAPTRITAPQDRVAPLLWRTSERSKGADFVNVDDVVIKETKPLRLAEARGVAAGLAPEHIGPVFLALAPKLIEHLQQVGARAGTLVHHYDEPAGDGSVGVQVGYEIGQQPCPRLAVLRSSTYPWFGSRRSFTGGHVEASFGSTRI